MSQQTFSLTTFELLDDLAANNHKAWFDSHRQDLNQHVLHPFAEVLTGATIRLARTKLPLAGGKKTMFRMHRDVRFSHDKRPYKTNASGLLTPNGRKAENHCLVYLQLASDGGFVAGGFYQLPTPRLNKIREHLVTNTKEFTKILAGLKAHGLDLSREEALKRMPRGFEDFANHPHAHVLRLKSLIVKKTLPRKVWIDGNIIEEVTEFSRHLADLNLFGSAALH